MKITLLRFGGYLSESGLGIREQGRKRVVSLSPLPLVPNQRLPALSKGCDGIVNVTHHYSGLTQLAQRDRNFIVFTYYVKVAYPEGIAEI
ncbi:hypothetical protein, partial [Nostoc sp.]|uniref:hypothetical protein n=1 Tax=Nostoc sp. TaxID=1180 RepID=UPI002FFBBA6D